MKLEIVITVLIVNSMSIGRASGEIIDGTFACTTVGQLSLPFTYDLFEAVRNKTGSVKLWCAKQCLGKPFCYFFTGLDNKCVLYIVGIINVESTIQPYTPSLLPDSTQVYRKQGVTLQKIYEIGTTYVTYDEAQAACADLGMEVVTFASVQEFQTLSQLIDASPVSGGVFWVGLLRQPDNTWVYADGGPDIPELWIPSQPDNTWVYVEGGPDIPELWIPSQPDHTWVYVEGGPDIPELWIPSQPDGDGPCAHMWHEYKFNDVACDSLWRRYICQGHTLV